MNRRAIARSEGIECTDRFSRSKVPMAEHDLESVAFPRLDQSQISALAGCGAASLVRYKAGQRLFQVGDRDYRFFVIQAGELLSKPPSIEKVDVLAVKLS
jgi:hypothetical protein